MVTGDREERVGVFRVKLLLDALPGNDQSLQLRTACDTLLTGGEVVFFHVSE